MNAPIDPQAQALIDSFLASITTLQTQGVLPASFSAPISLTRPKDPSHGDFACNIALIGAKQAEQNPRDLANLIIHHLPKNDLITNAVVAGAGFINITLDSRAKFALLDDILTQGERFGLSDVGEGKTVQVEFVSANPTSALHVGHGRGAAYGMSVANLLEATGYQVCREYYVNDAGRQMDILATSTYLRYLQACGERLPFPKNGYQGEYVADFGRELVERYGERYRHGATEVFLGVPMDAVYDDQNTLIDGDKEAHIDGLIARSKELLADGYTVFLDYALNNILDDIKDDLAQFGVRFENWYSERSLGDKIAETLQLLDDKGFLYEKDGNVWFRSTDFGDEKDRVVKRANGLMTYFASDIAYHKDKFDRGFDTVINVWGADHHGYIPRVKAALTAMGIDATRLEVMLVQFVALYRGEQKVQMSSRSGQFITLRELRNEVGNDAARFYYVARTPNVHMDFDLELAKSQSRDNAVYYIQYAHARICRVLEKLAQSGVTIDLEQGKKHQELLTAHSENELLKRLAAYSETITKAAKMREPHILTNYLKDLASEFHAWYNDERILPKDIENIEIADTDEHSIMHARLRLSLATKQVLANGLHLLGLSAPQAM